ncbi:MAG TPA: class I SAM-dependent methyltransferase [Pseudomonadales bacterium]|jgi:SAM-dependent methyltransferase|nr:class I SAM-dependent methyltransferase [Pseudomonadales bacterium]MDP6316374.1 class I SAM-dependent methyltransferase [Pseudomonadales bacterium]MDP7314964.1 class I SAM-dependent methyltransferase [Pseudomonadales bacterium]HJL61310.1 class I SAM-dependent methyltransferase [Pseudomonadales bacterium]HJP49758.1 class I SAM-dependent methyltransferase [Pseudomonadales bacterium]|tara:strand:- start:344 stop:1087 length:744 start_codon:yes stop_codon:yes gene_type:complete
MSMETVNFDDLQLKANERILDLGCGEGRHAITAYMLANVESVGIDLNLNDLKTTRDRFDEFKDQDNDQKSLTISVASGQKLPFSDNSFDKVICSEVLEHIPDYHSVLTEIARVLKTGGIFAASVPRFFPEWICWQLSDEYHEVEGGHIRIFNANHLREDIQNCGFVFFKKHHAHSLHVPYWWLKCFFWQEEDEDEASIVSAYHRFLVWDLMKQPKITKTLDKVLNPVMGKSVVMYFVKTLPDTLDPD